MLHIRIVWKTVSMVNHHLRTWCLKLSDLNGKSLRLTHNCKIIFLPATVPIEQTLVSINISICLIVFRNVSSDFYDVKSVCNFHTSFKMLCEYDCYIFSYIKRITWSILLIQIMFKSKGTIAQETYTLVLVKDFGHPQTWNV